MQVNLVALCEGSMADTHHYSFMLHGLHHYLLHDYSHKMSHYVPIIIQQKSVIIIYNFKIIYVSLFLLV